MAVDNILRATVEDYSAVLIAADWFEERGEQKNANCLRWAYDNKKHPSLYPWQMAYYGWAWDTPIMFTEQGIRPFDANCQCCLVPSKLFKVQVCDLIESLEEGWRRLMSSWKGE